MTEKNATIFVREFNNDLTQLHEITSGEEAYFVIKTFGVEYQVTSIEIRDLLNAPFTLQCLEVPTAEPVSFPIDEETASRFSLRLFKQISDNTWSK